MIRGPILALRWVGPVALVSLTALLLLQSAGAQTRFTYSKGQSVSPAYEGWMPNEDGSFTLYFGYMNRRNPFLFTIRLPQDFGNKELIWTLTTHGRTEKAYASLKSDYQIDKQVISTEVGGDGGSLRDELRYNIPPELVVEGEARRTVKAGEPVPLVALAGDPDNLPARRDGKLQPRHPGERPVQEVEKASAPSAVPTTAETNAANLLYRPPSSIVPSSGPGLRLSWIVYRGKASAVRFSPEQMKTWTDTRAWANSPWSPPFTIPEPPPDGKWITEVRFQEPGIYTLRAVASDGSLFTYKNVTVTVTP